MQIGYYIATRLSSNKQQSFTKTVTRLAIAAVSISVCVVLLSYGILLGFKQEIRQKVKGYAGDISITRYQLASGNETNYFDIDTSFMSEVNSAIGVESIFPFINKAGIIKSDSTIEGIVFKGAPSDYNFSFYNKHIVKGEVPVYSDSSISYDIMISEHVASLMQVDTGDRLFLYFIDNNDVRRRRPKIVGIFNTGLLEFDKQFAISDIRMLQQLENNYKVAAGYEIKVQDAESLEKVHTEISKLLNYNYAVKTLKELYPTMFQWLELVDTNVLAIIILMLLVAIINIITVLLILIIDRIPMIGVLKSLGASSSKVMSIFKWQGLFILGGGLLLGNSLAIVLSFLQTQYKLFPLEPDTYYMDAVPFYLPIEFWVFINLGALLICFLSTYIPVRLISRISPSQSVNFR